jgi:hypothetical protein
MRKRRWLGLLAAGLLGLGIAMGGASPAFAQQQVCGNGGTGYCINAWFGGPPVKMYNGGKSNEDFEFIFNVKECGSGEVTSTFYGDPTNCPFSTAELDKQLRGAPIGQLEYLPTGQCVGTLTGSAASGVGGGTGTTQIYWAIDHVILINRYWSDYYSSAENESIQCNVTSGGNPGTPLYMNGYNGSTPCSIYTEWGGI